MLGLCCPIASLRQVTAEETLRAEPGCFALRDDWRDARYVRVVSWWQTLLVSSVPVSITAIALVPPESPERCPRDPKAYG